MKPPRLFHQKDGSFAAVWKGCVLLRVRQEPEGGWFPTVTVTGRVCRNRHDAEAALHKLIAGWVLAVRGPEDPRRDAKETK